MDHKMQKFVKKYYTNSPEHLDKENNISDAQFAEIVLNQSLRDFRKKQILNEIDQTLTNRNEQEFLRLVKELESISS